MLVWKYIFWISCALVFYNYIGYALIAFVVNLLFAKRKQPSEKELPLPGVSFIVAAFNEEDCIEKKILNSLKQQYPADKIEFIFITDGSTDRTAEIIGRYPDIQLLHRPERKGKSAAVNRAVQAAKNEILIFSDANTILNPEATLFIAQHYHDARTGGVAGEKKVMETAGQANDRVNGEGLYWKYESFLKRIDSETYSVVGAAGELFSVRKNAYEPVAQEVILDDFIVSLTVAQKGYRVVYEPRAYAMEEPSFSIKDEQKRKVRISAGGFQAIAMLWKLLLFWKNIRLSFLYISHRVMRWTTSPLALVTAFIANAVLAFASTSFVFKGMFLVQLAFYTSAIMVYWFPLQTQRIKLMKVPYYFVFMNISVIQGFFRFIRGKQSAAWEKARRSQPIYFEPTTLDAEEVPAPAVSWDRRSLPRS